MAVQPGNVKTLQFSLRAQSLTTDAPLVFVPTVPRHQTANGRMLLAEGAPDLMQRLSRLPAAPQLTIVYLRDRDYRFSAIALLVLTIILLGFAVGLAGRHSDTPTSPLQVRGETAPPQAMQAILRKSNSFLTAMPHTFHRQKFFSRQS
jgi:hypothetical protein